MREYYILAGFRDDNDLLDYRYYNGLEFTHNYDESKIYSLKDLSRIIMEVYLIFNPEIITIYKR